MNFEFSVSPSGAGIRVTVALVTDGQPLHGLLSGYEGLLDQGWDFAAQTFEPSGGHLAMGESQMYVEA